MAQASNFHIWLAALWFPACNIVSFSSQCSRDCFLVSAGALSVEDGDCPWSLSRKRAHYSVTPKGHLEGAINLQMNMSATFQGGEQRLLSKWKTKPGRIERGKSLSCHQKLSLCRDKKTQNRVWVWEEKRNKLLYPLTSQSGWENYKILQL